MTPEMEAAMRLEGATDGLLQDDPNAAYEGETPETWAARGVAESHQYMAKNGPIQPTHMAPRTMTKAQLEEQRMNEDHGYPSNLDEASKIKAMEGDLADMKGMLQQIAGSLGASPNVAPSSQVNTPQNGRSGGTPESPDEHPDKTPVRLGIARQQSPQSIDCGGSPEPRSKPLPPRKVTLSSGKVVTVPQSTSTRAMNLGPATSINSELLEAEDEFSVGDGTPLEELCDDLFAVVPEVVEEPEADPRLEQVATMVLQVNEFLSGRDVHRDFRRLIASHIHRHLGYSGWKASMKAEFDARFKSYLSDSGFVTSICKKVYDMDMGYALGVKPVVSLLVASAGFTAFTMIGLD